ncbi:MAG: MoaD/ThiS family protein, partial [Xanthomonadales bacterium]|nr:MoaD/ThiS family protein [Xanthomonadales bacterium]
VKNTVRYFALFRDQVGCESEAVEWTGGTAAELFHLLGENHPSLKAEAAALVAVNDEMAHWETSLEDGDEVLFFPPVAGG